MWSIWTQLIPLLSFFTALLLWSNFFANLPKTWTSQMHFLSISLSLTASFTSYPVVSSSMPEAKRYRTERMWQVLLSSMRQKLKSCNPEDLLIFRANLQIRPTSQWPIWWHRSTWNIPKKEQIGLDPISQSQLHWYSRISCQLPLTRSSQSQKSKKILGSGERWWTTRSIQ